LRRRRAMGYGIWNPNRHSAVAESKQETNPMPLKIDAVPVPDSLRKRHERKGGADLDMYSVARLDGFLRLTVGAEPAPRPGTVPFLGRTGR